MSFIDEDLTFFSQKPLAYLQPNFECKILGTSNENSSTIAGHMTKMAIMPIYGKNTLKTFFPGTTGQILMKLCMKHQRPKPFIHFANYDPGLTLTYFTARSNFAT